MVRLSYRGDERESPEQMEEPPSVFFDVTLLLGADRGWMHQRAAIIDFAGVVKKG
jgi:hypothetical protein